jgi:hypothetical protein
VAVLAFSCATGKPMTPDEQQVAQTFALPNNPSVTRVYIVRPPGFVGSAVLTQVLVDGRMAGAVGPGNYFVLDLPTGEHVFALVAVANQQASRLNL